VPDPTIRFAVGSEAEPFSSVWRLWAHNDEVYLSTRVMARTLKISLHSSGEWIAAFTEQSGVKIEETGSRRHRTWQRPAWMTPSGGV
jgi:hypothetical protein